MKFETTKLWLNYITYALITDDNDLYLQLDGINQQASLELPCASPLEWLATPETYMSKKFCYIDDPHKLEQVMLIKNAPLPEMNGIYARPLLAMHYFRACSPEFDHLQVYLTYSALTKNHDIINLILNTANEETLTYAEALIEKIRQGRTDN